MLTSTLLTQTTCWWFELAGSHEITAWEQVTPLALTQVGPMLAVSLPITIVQAASLEVRRDTVTDRTLMRCGFRKKCIIKLAKLFERQKYKYRNIQSISNNEIEDNLNEFVLTGNM